MDLGKSLQADSTPKITATRSTAGSSHSNQVVPVRINSNRAARIHINSNQVARIHINSNQVVPARINSNQVVPARINSNPRFRRRNHMIHRE